MKVFLLWTCLFLPLCGFAINEKGPDDPAFSQIKPTEVVKAVYNLCYPHFKSDTTVSPKVLRFLNESLRQPTPSDSILFRLADVCGKVMLDRGKLLPCISILNQVLSYFEQEKEKEISGNKMGFYVCNLYMKLGIAYEGSGLGKQAMNLYKNAMLLAEEYRLETIEGQLLNNMANLYYNQNSFEKAMELYHKAVEINSRLNKKEELFINYNNLAGISMRQQKYEAALNMSFLALQQINRQKDPYLYYSMLSNMSSIYSVQGKMDVATKYLTQATQYMRENGYFLDYAQNLLLLSDLYQKKGQRSLSLSVLYDALSVGEKTQNKPLLSDIYQNLSQNHAQRGSYKEAYQCLLLCKKISDSTQKLDNIKRLEDLELVYESERKGQENDLLIKEYTIRDLKAKRHSLVLISILALSVLIVFLITYLYQGQKRQRKAEKTLAIQQNDLVQKEKGLLIERQAELQKQLEIRNRELTSKVLSLVKNNEFIIDLNNELRQLLLEINPKDTAKKDHIKQLATKLRIQGNNTTDAEFKYYFEQVYQSFYDNLIQGYPMLTTKDLRLCAFLRLGLSTKEIATITFREIRSIESARNRLRKKMNLLAEADLSEFFSHF